MNVADPARRAVVLSGCAVTDTLAVGLLLVGLPLPRALVCAAAGALHGLAVLLLATAAHAEPGRRRLSVAAALAVPCAGVALAAVVLGTRGRGTTATRSERAPRRPRAQSAAEACRLAEALAPCDAVHCGDEMERRAALAALVRRADPEAITVLRWAAAGRDPELALSAALALDELGERTERRRALPSQDGPATDGRLVVEVVEGVGNAAA